MLKYYKYTEKERELLIKSMVILVDTREKKNDHIISYFERQNIPYKHKALSYGDYSFYIPQNKDLNIDRDLFFDKEIMIERKHDLDEISGNITHYRSRFEEELSDFAGKKYLLIENASYDDIITKRYNTKISAKAFLATIHTYNHRYGIEVMFMPHEQYSAVYIYEVLSYFLRSIIR